MRFPTLVALLASTVSASFIPASTANTDLLASNARENQLIYESTIHPPPSTCNLQTAFFRKEWDAHSPDEKRAYIAAVQCILTKPSISGDLVPGARSRFDDFLGTHINQTLRIHNTGNFLSWHRYFTWTYEKALREECGYEGRQPYLNWGRYSIDLLNAPVFDGSDTSISGNGAYRNHSGVGLPPQAPTVYIPPGNGSGCVTSGPFQNMTVRLGPVSPVLDDVPPNPQENGLGYNPRCLRRDLSEFCASTATSDQNVTSLILQNDDIASFQNDMQGLFNIGSMGVHTGGHYWVGGDPGGDFFTSPGDPYFYFHHAQIDRTWWMWQNQDPANRTSQIAGTNTFYNNPPSANTTLDDIIDLGVNDGFEGIKIRDAVSTLDGPFCYYYV